MNSEKGYQEEEDEEKDDLGAKKDTPQSNNNSKGIDGKNYDKANAMRSKHSVTEQRRRSKINERFQILRELIPRSDQKRDTASFLLEVIQYVQYLQEKVQKHEGSYQPWSSEPTKLMPWRNSHWRTQTFVTPQEMKDGSASVPSFPGRLVDNTIDVASIARPNVQNPIDSDNSKDVSSKQFDQQTHLANQPMRTQVAFPGSNSVPFQSGVPFSDSQSRAAPVAESSECPISDDNMDHLDDVTIEGGTISISSMYSQRLLNTLTQALQSSGVDLSQATIAVQINLGKRANRELASGVSIGKDRENSIPLGSPPVGNCGDTGNGEDLNQVQKRMRI